MADLLDRLNHDLSEAVKNRDDVSVSTLRFLLSGIHNQKIAKGSDLTDEEITAEIAKNAKRHKESIEAFSAGGRDDLVEKETAELEVLTKYLPQMLSDREMEKMVDEAISAVGAGTISDMGRVVGAVMSSAGARADGAKVAEIVRSKLAPKS